MINWEALQTRQTRPKPIGEIALPYKCGRIEAGIIVTRFLLHVPPESYWLIQPRPTKGAVNL